MSTGSSQLDDDSREGATPLDADEIEGLIPTHLETVQDLNQWEALNISKAHAAYARHKSFELTIENLRRLHRSMFDETWKWAGTLRRSDKNVSPYHWTEVPVLLRQLVDDTRAQYEASPKTPDSLDEIAVRFHHRLVQIHPWPNGNGRHGRLATDLLLISWGRPPFSWGGADLTQIREARTRYIRALRAADGWDYQPLRQFVRS